MDLPQLSFWVAICADLAYNNFLEGLLSLAKHTKCKRHAVHSNCTVVLQYFEVAL